MFPTELLRFLRQVVRGLDAIGLGKGYNVVCLNLRGGGLELLGGGRKFSGYPTICTKHWALFGAVYKLHQNITLHELELVHSNNAVNILCVHACIHTHTHTHMYKFRLV